MGESTGVPADEKPEPPETDPNPEPTEEEEAPEATPKKKKKKKKDKVKEEEREEEVTSAPSCQLDGNATTPELNGTMNEENGNEAGEKKKKKKKKKEEHVKEEEEEEEQVQLSATEVHCSDSSGYHSDKPSKKRRHETGTDVTSGFSETPKSKKKRKSDIEQFA